MNFFHYVKNQKTKHNCVLIINQTKPLRPQLILETNILYIYILYILWTFNLFYQKK